MAAALGSAILAACGAPPSSTPIPLTPIPAATPTLSAGEHEELIAKLKGLAVELVAEYRNPLGGYSVRYPEGWSYKEVKVSVAFVKGEEVPELPGVGTPLASLLEDRRVAFLLAGIATLQIGLVAAGLEGWQCPVKATLGVPCPGCGLSTAVILLLRGEWRAALSAHAFAPIFLLGLVLMAVVAILPGRLHRETVLRIAALEHRTGIVTLVLVGLVIYWCARLLGLS